MNTDHRSQVYGVVVESAAANKQRWTAGTNSEPPNTHSSRSKHRAGGKAANGRREPKRAVDHAREACRPPTQREAAQLEPAPQPVEYEHDMQAQERRRSPWVLPTPSRQIRPEPRRPPRGQARPRHVLPTHTTGRTREYEQGHQNLHETPLAMGAANTQPSNPTRATVSSRAGAQTHARERERERERATWAVLAMCVANTQPSNSARATQPTQKVM